MKRIVAVAVIALFAGAAQAADDGVYVRLDSGWSFSRDAGKGMENDIGNSPIVGAGVGYRFQSFRADVTLGYRGGYRIQYYTSGVSITGDASTLTGMANVYFDVARVGMFTPYIGAGLGFSSNTVSDLMVMTTAGNAILQGADATSLALQLSAGVGIDVAPKWTVDVGYRYMDMGEGQTGDILFNSVRSVRLEQPVKGDFRAHEIQAGIRYQF